MNDFVITIGNKKKDVAVSGNSTILVNGEEIHCELIPLSEHSYVLKIGTKVYEVSADKQSNGDYSIFIGSRNINATIRSALQEKAAQLLKQKDSGHNTTEVKAPMPGMILKIKQKQGETTTQGQTVVILEAMKMENDIRTPVTGTLKEIYVTEGTAVEKGTRLFSVE